MVHKTLTILFLLFVGIGCVKKEGVELRNTPTEAEVVVYFFEDHEYIRPKYVDSNFIHSESCPNEKHKNIGEEK